MQSATPKFPHGRPAAETDLLACGSKNFLFLQKGWADDSQRFLYMAVDIDKNRTLQWKPGL